MNDREVQDPNKEKESSDLKDKDEINKKNWSFCPVCGSKIPQIQNLKFCVKCGLNIQYIKEHKRIPLQQAQNPYIKPTTYPQSYIRPIKLGPKKLSDEEILNTKDRELWGTWPSIGIPLGAFLLMDLVTAGILFIIMFFSVKMEFLYDLISNPYFFILSLFFELIFILVPILYVGKYLQSPTLKNRLGLLGFTRKGFNRTGLIKEILIGLGFAVAGIFIVMGISFLTEFLLETFFRVEFTEASTDTDIIISSADIFSIILLSVIMIVVIGTSEEIVFRGFMQKGLTRNLGNIGGILLTAFIFAMIHVIAIILYYLESPFTLFISFIYSFFPYFALSLLLGLIYYWRNENLIAVIITHGVYNTLTIILAFIFQNLF
ncbi:MAG: CPBP family intramembrane glutamic endopeptidase [Promethearchaeota archaeon]